MTINKGVLLALLAVSLLQANPSYAKSVPLTPVTTVYVDDHPLPACRRAAAARRDNARPHASVV